MFYDRDWTRRWIAKSADVIRESRARLIELDRAIGDGDHGENMDRGFASVMKSETFQSGQSANVVLKDVARTLLSTVGGAAGPLYGTAFLRAANAVAPEEVPAQAVARGLEAAAAGVRDRGKASAGEKTMLDALIPAADAARAAADDGLDFAQTWQAAADAAEQGAEATLPMRATKGRASYLGERSRGHLDPGAVSTALIIRCAADTAQEGPVSENG